MAELKYLKLELLTIESQIFVLDTSMALKAIYRSSTFGGLAHHSADCLGLASCCLPTHCLPLNHWHNLHQ